MLAQEEFYGEVLKFLKHSRHVVLLVVGNVDSNLPQALLQNLQEQQSAVCFIDFFTKIDVEATLMQTPLRQPLIGIVTGLNANKKLENIYMKYRLERWQTKIIIFCPPHLLHPTLNPSVYFAPIVNNRIQRHLLRQIKLNAKTPVMTELMSPSFFAKKQDHAASTAETVLRNHFLNQRLFVRDFVMMHFFANRTLESQTFRDLCFSLLHASQDDPELEIAAANAVTILNFAGHSLAQHDLSNVRIRGAILDFCNLGNAKLINADLTDVSLRQTWLSGADLSGAKMNNINLGEYPYLTFDQEIQLLCFSINKGYLIVAQTSTILVWDLEANKLITTLNLADTFVISICAHPQLNILASGSRDGAICIWDLSSGELLSQVTRMNPDQSAQTNNISALSFSPDGTLLASIDHSLCLWNFAANELHLLHEETQRCPTKMQFCANGYELVCGDDEKNVYVWNIVTHQFGYHLQGMTSRVWAVTASPDGKWLAAGDMENVICVWEASSGQLKACFKDHRDSIKGLAFSNDSQLLASASWDGNICLWDVEKESLKQTFKGHQVLVNAVRFSPNGQYLVSGGHDKSVRIWDFKYEPLPSFTKERPDNNRGWIRSLQFTCDGQLLATGCSVSNEINIRDANTGRLIFTIKAHTLEVSGLEFSRDQRLLVSGSFDGGVRWWSRKTGNLEKVFNQAKFVITGMQYRCNGELMVVGHLNKKVCLLEANTGQILMHLSEYSPQIFAVHCSEKLELYAFGCNKIVYLWDITRQCMQGSFTQIGKNATSMKFNIDGSLLALADQDGSIYIWRTINLEHYATLPSHTQEVSAVAFSSNGKLLASVSWDTKIQIWDVVEKKLLHSCTATVPITSICFKSNDQIAIGCLDSSAQCWQRRGMTNTWALIWNTHALPLMCSDACITDCVGLSAINKRVLEQRGSVEAKRNLNHISSPLCPI